VWSVGVCGFGQHRSPTTCGARSLPSWQTPGLDDMRALGSSTVRCRIDAIASVSAGTPQRLNCSRRQTPKPRPRRVARERHAGSAARRPPAHVKRRAGPERVRAPRGCALPTSDSQVGHAHERRPLPPSHLTDRVSGDGSLGPSDAASANSPRATRAHRMAHAPAPDLRPRLASPVSALPQSLRDRPERCQRQRAKSVERGAVSRIFVQAERPGRRRRFLDAGRMW
jgi:hypothetical protein